MKQLFKGIKIFIVLSIMSKAGLASRIDPSATNFKSPVKYKINIAGSFGELRSRHFHGGLDIRSNRGGGGDSVFASDAGYVSRIKIQRGGYGKVIYITHANGYSTTYAHLDKFNEVLENYISSIQEANMNYEIEVYPLPHEFPINQSEHIAFLGNTGHSYGPHLHFEIRDAITDSPMNPYLFGIKPIDDLAPVITSIRISAISPEYQKIWQERFLLKKDRKGKSPNVSAEVPSMFAGISISGYDQVNGSSSKNGIYQLRMYVDEVLYYSIKMDKFSFEENSQIEAHTDYEIKADDNRTELLLYRLPGNNLQVIDYHHNNGLIPVDNIYKNVKIVAEDFDGNTTTHILSVKSRETLDLGVQHPAGDMIYQGVESTLSCQNISATIPATCLIKNCALDVREINGIYYIGRSDIPLLKPIKISVKIPDIMYSNLHKMGFMRLGNEAMFYGQEIIGDSVVIYSDDFGRYGFFIDSMAPKIKPSNFSLKSKATEFKFKISDNVNNRLKGLPFKYNVWINDKWIACEYKEMNETLYIPIGNLSQGDHYLKINAIDQFGNEGIWQSAFVKE
ncbi:MAG: hypothetical protein RLZZ546_1397 [Bacteroidota bacterium]|jgi:hypothetical protein